MGKKRGAYNFGAGDLFGGQSLTNDPAYQKAVQVEKVLGSVNPLGEKTTVQDNITSLQHSKDVYDKYLDGDYSGSAEDIDYRVGENQSAPKQLLNGLGRLLPLTATKLLGQANGMVQAAEYGKNYLEGKEAGDIFLDNDVTKSIQQAEDGIKESMPIYATKKYDEGSLFEQMGTAKFWGDDTGDGIAFLAAQFLGTKGIASILSIAAKGGQFLADGIKAAELLEKVPGAAKIATMIAKNASSVGAGIINAGFSGALQAQDTATQIRDGLAGKVNSKTGREFTKEEINKIASEKAANTFNATFVAHILPGIWESRIMLGVGAAKLGDIQNAITKAVGSKAVTMTELLAGTGADAIKKNVFKEAGKGLIEGALVEGVWEENVEQSIQNYDIKTGLNNKSVGGQERTLNYAMGLLTNFGNKQDAKAIVLGAILGGPMGAFGHISHVGEFNEKIPEFLHSLASSDARFQSDIKSMYKVYDQDVKDNDGKVSYPKGSLILDEEGNPQEDPEKLKKLTFQLISLKNLWDKHTVATMSGNKDLATMNENMAISSAVFRELATAEEDGSEAGTLSFLKWRIKKQIEEQEKAAKPSAADGTLPVNEKDPQSAIDASQAESKGKAEEASMGNNFETKSLQLISSQMRKVDSFAKAYKTSSLKAKSLSKIGQSQGRLEFHDVVQKGLFYEEVKRSSYNEMIDGMKERLKDPLENTDSIVKEIDAMTKLHEDSMNKSKAYLNNTDEIYDQWKSPREKLLSLITEKYNIEGDTTTDLQQKELNSKKLNTTQYKMNEMDAIEGLGIKTPNMQFNEELSQVAPSDRVSKPIGNRNKFFWNAGNDFSAMEDLNKKISDYDNNKLSLSDVLNYAKQNISHLDNDTAKRLNGIITASNTKLDTIDQKLATVEPDLYGETDPDTGETDYLGPNPEFTKLQSEKATITQDIESAKQILTDKQKASEADLVNNQPENIEKHLIKEHAETYLEKGKSVVANALDENGEVKEDFFDRTRVANAISDATGMRDAIQDRLESGDLKGMTGLGYLLTDANRLLEKLYRIREESELNESNRGARQLKLGREEAFGVMEALGFDPNSGEVLSGSLFQAFDSALNNTLGQSLSQITELEKHHYEAISALFYKLQSVATEGQKSELKSILKSSRIAASQVVANLIGDKGTHAAIANDFKTNPRQAFPAAWSALSQKYIGEYPRVSEDKGSPLNRFRGGNSIEDLQSTVNELPDNSKELGMPKEVFQELLNAYKQAVYSERANTLLNADLKSMAETELKKAEEATFVPTVQQNISIREGVSWLKKENSKTSAFSGWGFLRGIAGTGKTSVVLKWILDTSGIDKNSILTTALTETATNVAAQSTGTTGTLFETLEENGIPENIKLIVIDEYGTIGERRLALFEEMVSEARNAGQDIKVLMLGDPTQLTPSLQTNLDVNSYASNPRAGNIDVINPLTVVYRSDVSAVNEASDIFQANNKAVESINVRSDRALGEPMAIGVQTSSAATIIPELIKANVDHEVQNKLTPRTRVIIVADEDSKAKYEGVDADIITVYDAQSKTYDEVYVDLSPQNFNNNPERYNKAMYTAASRAKAYTFLTYAKGENTVDDSIKAELINNKDKLKEAKTEFIQAKTEELAMMQGLKEGKSLKQTVKDTAKTTDDAGKSSVDVEKEKSETEDEPDVIEVIPPLADTADHQVDDTPEGEVDPETEQPAGAPDKADVVLGTVQAVPNVDSEAYPSLKSGEIGAGSNSRVIYLATKEDNNERSVTIVAKNNKGEWVKIGKIFQEQIDKEDAYKDLKDKFNSTEPFYTTDSSVLNGRRNNDVPYTEEQLLAHTLRSGTISESQFLRFNYDSETSASPADIQKLFKDQFFHKSQAQKADKIIYRIFTISELTAFKADGSVNYDGTFKPVPGLPYAIVGSDGVSFKGAMFTRLQANHLNQEDDQVKTLRSLADSVEKIEKMTGILMGTKSFNDLLRVFKHSLDIEQVQDADGLGTKPKVRVKDSFTRADVKAFAEDMFEKDGRNVDSDILAHIDDSNWKDVIGELQNAASLVYGVKNEAGKYTQAEIDGLGEEWEGVPLAKPQNRKGEALMYAKLKADEGHKYKKQARLSIDNGIAQLAFNQLARSNEFVGGTRIRVVQHLGKNSDRHVSHTGKSLINSEGGSARVYELMGLMASEIVAPKMVTAGRLTENEQASKEGLKKAIAEVRELVNNSGQDPLLFLQKELNKLGDDAVSRTVESILEKKETPPVNLNTLKQITGDNNFDSNGSHLTSESYPVTNSRGTTTKQTFLRKPLNRDKFNALGSDPIANADVLKGLVTSTFSGIAPTAISVDFSENAGTGETVSANPEDASESTTEFHAKINAEIADLSMRRTASTNPIEKLKLTAQIVNLENSRGRLNYDSNADRPAPGEKISIAAAKLEIQRLIPSIQPGELEFLEKALLNKLANPGEDLLGLFDKGKIFLGTEDGSVYDKVLRHEVMHKIYNDFLSSRERKQLRAELDPESKLTPEQFDELVADRFMTWKQEGVGVGNKIKELFTKVLNWFGFYYGNKTAVATIFNNVENGKYSKPASGLSDVRRAFSNIKKYYSNVENYKSAVSFIHGQVRDSVILKDLDSAPITMKEAKTFIKDKLVDKKNKLTGEYTELLEGLEYLKSSEVAEEIALVPSIEKLINDTAAQLGVLNSIFPKTKGKVFDELWKDIYPSYSIKEGESISAFEDYTDEYTEHDDLNSKQSEDDKSASSLADHTINADERNQEGKITDNVKNFLSFVFRAPVMVKNATTGEMEEVVTRINPRYAYLECLRTLSGLVSSEGNLKDQIVESATYNGIDTKGKSDGARIIRYLLNLVDDATDTTYIDAKGVAVNLKDNLRFTDENTMYMASEGGNIKSSTKSELKGNTTVYERNPKESTPRFTKRVAAATGLDSRLINATFKQMQAQETMREVMSNFLSQRESNPMIGEQSKTFKNGMSVTSLRYFRAQMHGAERVVSTDIENSIKDNWLKITGDTWKAFDAAKDSGQKVSLILKALGINKDTKEMNLSMSEDIVQNLKAFKNVVEKAYVSGKPVPIKFDSGDNFEAEQESVQYKDVEYLLSDEASMINNITRMLSRNSAEARPAKYVSVDGKNRYTFFNSSQAMESIERVIAVTGLAKKNATSLPAHLKTSWGKMNIFVEGRINRINKIIDHDGIRREKGEEFAKGYPDETDADNLQRQFAYSFLNYIKGNTGKSDTSLKYVQYFYTISNRPRMMGAEINVLKPTELREASKQMLMQHLLQDEHENIANYNKFKSINMESLGDAIDHVLEGKPRNTKNYENIVNSPELQEKILDKFSENLKEMASTVTDKIMSEQVIIGDDAGKVGVLMKDRTRAYLEPGSEVLPQNITQTRDNLGYTKEQILPLVEQWVANNYINSYFMNQIPVGNFNYFKSALDLVKRMSGVFAPGTKGLVSKSGEFFMKPKFRMAIMEDPRMFSDEISQVFKDHNTALYNNIKDKARTYKNILGQEVTQETGFELADGQGFMLPSRAENIIAGMGQAYNAGAIFKPAHYEIVDRPGIGFTPVMVKYSSVVLSDDLVSKFPKLLKLRQSMERSQTDELIFDSANKVGQPNFERPVPGTNNFTSDSFDIPEGAVVSLSNENYRLQLNPTHETFSSVANPTQLGYFLNVLGKVFKDAGKINDPAAVEVYEAIGKLIDHGLKKVTSGLTSKGLISKKQIIETLTGAGNERVAEMLQDLSYNMPNIADKALIQIMNLFSKKTVQVKFKGGKFVLQSAYGFEMIKDGSKRMEGLSEEQQKAHKENWSRYGDEERKKLVEDSRNLKYGVDEKGRLYAEVLMDKSFAGKIKAGDFILPDALAYRVPSTELHSSIAVKVAGFYDSKGSNVVVAPPELVVQHGSDFDVDSLYVIGREIYAGALPELGLKENETVPGYEFDSRQNALVFNKNNWEKRFPKWYAQAGTDTKLIRKIDKLYEMYLRNSIVESFLHVVSHPVNITRMTEPISVQVIEDVLVDLGLNTKKRVDLSNPLDNLEVYNSNFQGAKLVGVFANGMKSLAYMLKAGPEGGYPTIKEESAVNLEGVAYGEFTEQYPDGKTIWQVLDAFVNTAVDNVKEQQLFKINATNATGNMYVAAQALGIPLKSTVSLMLQPIGLMHTKLEGKIEKLKASLLAAYNLKAAVKMEGYADLRALASSLKAPKLSENISKTLEELDEKGILKQVALMASFENLYNLGQDVSLFSSSVGIVQDLPVMYEDIEKRADGWDKMGYVDDTGNFNTNEDFRFDISNLFTAQPNIKAAYSVFQKAKETAEMSLTKHLPAVRAFVKELVEESGVRLSFKQNTEDMKNELISYLVSSMYSLENKLEEPFAYMYKNVERISTGKQAWSQRFIANLETDKKGAENGFLKKIGILNRYGMKTLTFATSSNSDYMDNLEMQEEFEKLPEQTKKDLVKYAILNYGLKFGVKNYSMFIPVQYLKPVDAHLATIDRKMRDISIGEDGKVLQGELRNIRDNFLLRLAVNNVESLPFISKKAASPIQTEGKYIVVMEPTGPREIPSLSGMDDFYYNRKYANPMEGDKRTISAEKFPQFIKTNDTTVMMRVNSPDSDFVYYQRVGSKNWLGGYDASTEALSGQYNLDKYFGKNLIPVPVADINTSEFSVNNDYVAEGSKVIVYGYNNESRDQGRLGTVTKVAADLTNPSKKTIQISEDASNSLNPEQEAIVQKVLPFLSLIRERFNLPVLLATTKDVGTHKGIIRNGTILLNMDTMTMDTAFHEVAHPLIEAISSKNTNWYNNLVKEVTENSRGRDLLERIAQAYPELTSSQQMTEAMVSLVGEYAAGNLNEDVSLKGSVMRLFRAIGDIVRNILKSAGVINLDTLSRDEMSALTLKDISLIMGAKDANIELDLSGFVQSNKQSKVLNDIEVSLFNNGQITLTCKV